jgi:hypothetical protein
LAVNLSGVCRGAGWLSFDSIPPLSSIQIREATLILFSTFSPSVFEKMLFIPFLAQSTINFLYLLFLRRGIADKSLFTSPGMSPLTKWVLFFLGSAVFSLHLFPTSSSPNDYCITQLVCFLSDVEANSISYPRACHAAICTHLTPTPLASTRISFLYYLWPMPLFLLSTHKQFILSHFIHNSSAIFP